MDFTRGPANVDNLLATTLSEQKEKLTEQWIQNNVILKFFEKEAKEIIDGGISIVEPLEYDDNGTVAWVGRNSSISVTENEFMTHARFTWATIAGALVVNDHDVAQNMGKNQIINLVNAKIKNLQNTFNDKLERAMLDDSTVDANTIWTLYDIVDSSDPTLGNLGDIDRDSYSWWQATEATSGAMATQGLEDIRTNEATVSRSMSDRPNLHVTTQAMYLAYQARHTPLERFASRDVGDQEFDSLAFAKKPVVFSFATQSGTWLGLNTKYLKFRVNRNMNYLQQPWVRGKGEQYKSAIVQTQCQMTCTRPKAMFKLSSLS